VTALLWYLISTFCLLILWEGAHMFLRSPKPGSTKARIAAEHQIEAAADAKRKTCAHSDAVPVDNDVLGRVAWWCEECETQLPPEFRPPKMVPHAVTTQQLSEMTVAQYTAMRQGYLLPPNTVCQDCGSSAEDAWNLGYTGKDWAELYGKPLCPVCNKQRHALNQVVDSVWKHEMATAVSPHGVVEIPLNEPHRPRDAKKYALEAKQHNAAYFEHLRERVPGFNEYDPQSPGWTIQNGRVPTDAEFDQAGWH
jgi:hypothetical protein